MADVYEQNLASKSTLTTTDYIRVVGSDNVSYKQLVSDVAKKIIENYTGSTLAGSAQSVKSAVDSLNSKTTFEMRSVSFSYSLASGANTNTNLKTLIDNDLPSGKRFITLGGYSTNSVDVVMLSVRYADTAYSLQIQNLGSITRTATVVVYYLCAA